MLRGAVSQRVPLPLVLGRCPIMAATPVQEELAAAAEPPAAAAASEAVVTVAVDAVADGADARAAAVELGTDAWILQNGLFCPKKTIVNVLKPTRITSPQAPTPFPHPILLWPDIEEAGLEWARDRRRLLCFINRFALNAAGGSRWPGPEKEPRHRNFTQ